MNLLLRTGAVILFFGFTIWSPAQTITGDPPHSQGTIEKGIVPTIPETISILEHNALGQPTQPPIGFDVANLGTGMSYHDGPVMETTHNVYFIWYGNWNGNTATSILPLFMQDLNGSSYLDTESTYFDNSRRITNNLVMSTQTFDNYSQGASLSDAGIQNVVSRALSDRALPTDPNGIYFVLTSADVNESSGFCTVFCGWHNHASLNGTDIKYSFVGNSQRCGPGVCEVQTVGPNGTGGADGMANVMSHELNETLTDPDLNAWFDPNGQEVGDKCNFNFGPEFTAPNGAKADIALKGRNYLIQQNWLNSGSGGCTMSYQPLTGLCYQAHVANLGWLPRVCDGDVAGTVHQSRQMEAVIITAPPGHSVCYQAHVADLGWLAPVCDGAIAGTTGQGRRMEALKVWFQSGGGHVEYFAQLGSGLFWTGPARDGAQIGTTGRSIEMEAVVIRAFP